ncbi:hypothetical protein [Paenibacillus alginolyticus]|uniref:Uncharacterized protein n=1 Tax=Paenibacillus alginolyticus TaxID=59839 RepID=A0ABT4GIJ4_9BACL|nr:hypothetical protein [Paenibacillus alginolyticus]MCY9696027.1 hypothetical protein [Paenibacillus alginolyticus]MEC0143409.1 hypothetical protein [Paenibacillus alginolyticus]
MIGQPGRSLSLVFILSQEEKLVLKKNLLFGLVTAVVIFTGLAVTQSPRGYAEENIFPTRFEGETHLSGQSMVWQQDGGDGYQQVTVQNITTGEKKANHPYNNKKEIHEHRRYSGDMAGKKRYEHSRAGLGCVRV